jgi:hypothetical protein
MIAKKPPPDDPKQSARFVETAKGLGANTSGAEFKRAFKKIVPKKIKPKSPKTQKRPDS